MEKQNAESDLIDEAISKTIQGVFSKAILSNLVWIIPAIIFLIVYLIVRFF